MRLRIMACLTVLLGASSVFLVFSPIRATTPNQTSFELATITVGLALVLGVVWMVLSHFLKPLGTITDQIDRTTALSTLEVLDDPGVDELRPLVASYNQMVTRLAHKQRTVQRARILGQEAERSRVSRELHDQVGQSLTYSLMVLKAAADNNPAVADELDAAREVVRGCLDEVRALSRALRPGALEDLGLSSALQGLAQEHALATQMTVERDIQPAGELDWEVQLAAYRIAQEAMTNIARHSRAHHVRLSLHRSPQLLELEVVDDGAGLGGAPEGVGRTGMAERAMLVGGQLDVNPAQPRGTRVALRVPLIEEN